MYTIKTPSFLRPSSRPLSPAPAASPSGTTISLERPTKPSMLSFSSFKRSASPLARQPANITQDGSYMEVLNLKLSEAVSKALAQPMGPPLPNEFINGRRPIPSGRGTNLGNLIASEINASRENPYLYRAVLRTLHRPLSVLVNNLSTNLLPLLSSSDFLSPIVPSQYGWQPNPSQIHAIGYANLAGELLDTFDQLGLGSECDMRGDGLKAVRDGLVSVVKRVIDPLVAGIKRDLMPHIEALESTSPTPCSNVSSVKTPGSKGIQHSSIVFLQGTIPTYSKALTRFITTSVAESSLATLLISLIWRGLVALSSRAFSLASPPTSLALPPALSRGKEMKRTGTSALTTPTTPPASRFTLKLPPSGPVSPSGSSCCRKMSAASDARALYDLLLSLPRPKGDTKSRLLAKEVADEAFEALAALPALLESAHAAFQGKNKTMTDEEMERDVEVLTTDVPTLVALPVLLRAYVFPHLPSTVVPTATPNSASSIHERTVANILGLSEIAYRNGCLSGFGREEECTAAVGQRVLDVLKNEMRSFTKGAGGEAGVVLRWLERQVAKSAEAAQH